MHIRPYVRLHEAGPAGSAGECGTSGPTPEGPVPGSPEDEPPRVTRPGAGDEVPAPLPDLTPFAARGTEETAELPAATDGGRRHGRKRTGGLPVPWGRAGRGAAGSADLTTGRQVAGTERRRPSTAVFAGVGVAAVLGAGLLTTQILTDDGRSADDGRAMRPLPTDAPTHALPTASPSTSQAPSRSERPRLAPSRTGEPGTPRADRGGDEHTTRSSPSPSREGGGKKRRQDGSAEGGHRHGRADQVRPDTSSGETLRPGDSGPEVAELQRRLKQAGYYDRGAEEDGVYSSGVQEGVFRYQAHYRLWDDPPGDYGPATRRHLESRTSG
ncbi:peptidoglycan-binding protein [Streptomyces tubbatahanensis]|uniref:Peptidoglycan-binding protein n=1 Tax=Streptomyces tubbatahanensis TaxID=2923272 RepID=A0ABY3XR07_9ACTN|nr:peptidoglycan-binding protein [Streptomyces tubbatahanensis]UNS96844.1 peptidoglycan-binding protein [Streptomyces tubbatahanensis]